MTCLGVILVVGTIFGCGPVRVSPPKDTKPADHSKTDLSIQDDRGAVTLSGGSMTRMSPVPNRVPEWFIQWKETATLDFDVRSNPNQNMPPGKGSKEKKISLEGALLKDVSGHVFDHGQPGTTFASNQAYAKKDPSAGDILVLQGHVRVQSGESIGSGRTKGILTCDQLQYNARSGTFRALGNVQFKGESATLGTLREAVASRDLRIIATPDLYNTR